jgi:hypothetical protein
VTVTGEVVIVAGCVVEAAVCVVVVAAETVVVVGASVAVVVAAEVVVPVNGAGVVVVGSAAVVVVPGTKQESRAVCQQDVNTKQTPGRRSPRNSSVHRSIDRSIAYFGRVCSGSGPRFRIGHRARVRLDGERASGVRHVIWSVWRAESHRSPHRRSSHKRNETDGPAGLEIHKRTRHPHCAVCRRDSS